MEAKTYERALRAQFQEILTHAKQDGKNKTLVHEVFQKALKDTYKISETPAFKIGDSVYFIGFKGRGGGLTPLHGEKLHIVKVNPTTYEVSRTSAPTFCSSVVKVKHTRVRQTRPPLHHPNNEDSLLRE